MALTVRVPDRLDEIIHVPTRLAIVTLLSQVEYAEFSFLRDHLRMTDGNLSSHLRVLEQAGYTEVTKAFVGRKPKTTYCLTARGRAAFDAYLTTLQDVIRSAQRSQPTPQANGLPETGTGAN